MMEAEDSLAEDSLVEEPAEAMAEVPCSFVTGQAGTGKTYSIKQRLAEEPSWGKLCSTTGISAVNLDAITVNSLLRYFNTESLRDSFITDSLSRRLHGLAKEYDNLVIDEISMMHAEQLDLIYRGVMAANNYQDITRPMGIVAVGDFAQLSPVKGRWAFKAECWERFGENTTRLTKVWRQDQPQFLAALNATRRGEGQTAADILTAMGVEWHTAVDLDFKGTTIIPKNDAVDNYNYVSLDRLPGNAFTVVSDRWGKLRSEWDKKVDPQTKKITWGIPLSADFKLGAYVMILTNDTPEWRYVNGDCGVIEGFEDERFIIRLVRNGHLVSLGKVLRSNADKDQPKGMPEDVPRGIDEYYAAPHRTGKGLWVEGQIMYYPLRLAYASTNHKSQGLSLDAAQIDFRHHFFGSPNMLYVALSRCRTLEGLRLVGQPEVFVKRCKCDPEVSEFL